MTKPVTGMSIWRNSRGYFRFPSMERDWRIGGWIVGILLNPGMLSVGVYLDDDPVGFAVHLPFLHLSLERDVEYQGTGLDCGWMLFRLLIGRQEIRLDLDLNFWAIGLQFLEADDFSLHCGPFNIQCEHDKLYDDDDFTIRVGGFRKVPRIRILSPVRSTCSCATDFDDEQ